MLRNTAGIRIVAGFAGIIHFSGDAPDRDQAHQLSAGVAHRGPDDKGLFARGPIAMVYRNFSSSKLEFKQPIVSEKNVIVVDGNIYEGNPLEIWEQHGPEGISKIIGEYAMVVWSRQHKVLWLVRDPCGTRPLYWTRRGHRVAFCNVLPPLLSLPWVSRDIATENIAEYLSFRYIHSSRTLLQDVHSVPPGHWLRIDASGTRLERWWTPSWAAPGAASPSEAEVIDHTQTTLHRSVARRIQSDRPTGLLLSGGIDSAAILHMANQIGPAPTTFTVSMASDVSDESAFAARVAKVMNAEHHHIQITDADFIQAISEASVAMGQPMPSATAALQWIFFKRLHGQIRILLSGDGGDEVFGGRGMEQIANRLRKATVIGKMPGPVRLVTQTIARKAKLNDWAASNSQFGMDRAIGGSRVFHSAERVTLLADPGMVRPGIRRTVLEPLYQEIDSGPVNSILHVWQRGWLPEDSLARCDRMAAAHGLEIRYPILDWDMLNLMAGLPGELKVRPQRLHHVTKWPLRRLLQEQLPPRLINRPKRSLPNPLDTWLRGAGSTYLREQIEEICSNSSDLFVADSVRKLAAEHQANQANRGLQLWTLMLFSTWRQTL